MKRVPYRSKTANAVIAILSVAIVAAALFLLDRGNPSSAADKTIATAQHQGAQRGYVILVCDGAECR